MASSFTFHLEDEPVPIVLIFHTLLRHALANRHHARIARSIHGSFALASTTDPQSLTISIQGDSIHLQHGIAEDARITIRLDFAKMSLQGYRPVVEGYLKHPLFTWKVARLLDFPVSSWADDAKRFWDAAHGMKGMPRCLRIICTDEERELDFGEGEPEAELYGKADDLAGLLSGGSILISDLMEGKLTMISTMEHLTVLSEATQKMMLGEFSHV